MTKKIATLIVSADDANLFIQDNQKSKIALDYSISLSTDKKIDYFFKKIPNNIETLPISLARCWYRNNAQIDNHEDKFSVGMILEKRICFMASNLIKFYFGFSRLANKYDIIEIPLNYPKYLNSIIEIFKDKIVFISEQKFSQDFETFFNKRAILKRIKVNKFSWILRILQKPFMKYLVDKVMVFPDWTYSKYRHKNYIYQNKINIFKSFYFKNIDKPVNIKTPMINTHAIENIFVKFNINDKDKKPLMHLMTNMINYESAVSLASINQQYNVMKELIDYYKPRNVIIPDDGEYSWYNVLMQITNKLKIDYTTILDGYLTYLDTEHIKVIEDGKTPLVDRYATMGTINHKLIGDVFPKFNRVLIRSPILSHISNATKTINQYDALIMMPIPNTMNPNSRWDMRNRYVIDLVNLLKKYNFKKIAIKIKPGPNLNDTDFLVDYFKKNYIGNIEFLKGYAYDAIAMSKIVIGQLGTTTYEALVMEKPYYIYEPIYCGLNNISASNSIANMKHIARDIDALSMNLINKDTINLPISQLIDGEEMSLRIV